MSEEPARAVVGMTVECLDCQGLGYVLKVLSVGDGSVRFAHLLCDTCKGFGRAKVEVCTP